MIPAVKHPVEEFLTSSQYHAGCELYVSREHFEYSSAIDSWN